MDQKTVYIDPESGLKQSQVKRLAVFENVVNFSANGTSDDVTDEVGSASITKENDGDQNKSGVIVDIPNNYCVLIDYATGDPIVDGGGRRVYGRLTDTLTGLAGTIDFVNGSNTANTSNDLSVSLSPGDYVVSDTSAYFGKILSITPTQITWTYLWLGPTETSAASQLEYTLSYFVDIGGTEMPHSLSQSINFAFAESVLTSDIPFDALLIGGGAGGSGGIVSFYHEQIAITAPGQTVFTLTYAPKDPPDLICWINGVSYVYGTHYTVTGTTLTWLNPFTLKTKDTLTVYYAY